MNAQVAVKTKSGTIRRVNSELIKQVFLAQQENPTKGDFVKLVEKNLQELGLTYEQVTSNDMTKLKLKHM